MQRRHCTPGTLCDLRIFRVKWVLLSAVDIIHTMQDSSAEDMRLKFFLVRKRQRPLVRTGLVVPCQQRMDSITKVLKLSEDKGKNLNGN